MKHRNGIVVVRERPKGSLCAFLDQLFRISTGFLHVIYHDTCTLLLNKFKKTTHLILDLRILDI